MKIAFYEEREIQIFIDRVLTEENAQKEYILLREELILNEEELPLFYIKKEDIFVKSTKEIFEKTNSMELLPGEIFKKFESIDSEELNSFMGFFGGKTSEKKESLPVIRNEEEDFIFKSIQEVFEEFEKENISFLNSVILKNYKKIMLEIKRLEDFKSEFSEKINELLDTIEYFNSCVLEMAREKMSFIRYEKFSESVEELQILMKVYLNIKE